MPILALAIKDLRLLLRDRMNAFFTFLFPLLLAIFFGAVFSGLGGGNSTTMPIVVVDEDATEASRGFVQDLTNDDALEVSLSPDKVAALNRVRKGEVAAAVIIAKGFEANANGLFAGKSIELSAVVDPSRAAEGGLLTGKLNQIAFMQLQRTFTAPGQLMKSFTQARESLNNDPGFSPMQRMLFNSMFDSVQALNDNLTAQDAAKTDATGTTDGSGSSLGGWQPIKVTVDKLEPRPRSGPTNSYATSFPQGIVWGLMGCVMAFVVSLSEERSRGTLLRLSASPLTPGAIIMGKAIACFVTALLVLAFLLVLAVVVFKVPVHSVPLMVVSCLIIAFGFTGVASLLASSARTEASANSLGRAVMLLLALIGGGSIPLAFMPKTMQNFAAISPFRWATVIVEGFTWRAFSAAELALPWIVLGTIGIAGLVAGGYLARRLA